VKPFSAGQSESDRTEEALRDSEDRFRLATEAGKIGIWDWDIVADEISWSDSLYRIQGLQPGQLSPTIEAFESLIHPDDRERVLGSIRGALENDAPYELEFRAVKPDGDVIWLFTSAKVVRRDGRPVRMLGATLDITERKRVEVALRESEERFAKAFNSAPLSLTISSLVTGKLIEVNDTFVAVTGFSREEAIGRTTAELGVWAKPGDREQELADVASAGLLRNREYVFRVRGGQEITGILSAETIEIGGEPCALTVIQDITDRKKFEQALREADRRKDEFLATLAHELRNPLAPIRNGIEVLKRAPGDAAASATVLEMMDRQLAQMVRLVDDLLDVSRISRGRIDLRTEPVELSAAVRNALEVNRQSIEAAGHDLVVDFPNESVFVEADLTRLSQVLSNLLDNAAKYTPRGGHIRLAVEPAAQDVTIRIRDDGIGIPETMIGQVFDLFTQVDGSLERSQSGLGIGLTIVKRLVEMHGGTIAARSEGPGKGTEFVVRLPRLAAQPDVNEKPALAAGRAGPRRRVLVVDDNRDAAESTAMMLGIMGHETRSAHDGPEALAAAESFRPDTVLLDIGMPGMNGYETCRRLRATAWGRDAVVVAVTGWGQEDDRERSREAGFDHHMTKPVEPESLQRLLARED
jgi:PAS domain S-box-containing protein